MKREEVEKQVKVMQAYLDGKDIEYRYRGDNKDWVDIQEPSWNWHICDYRVKKAFTMPSINWDQVSDKYNYLAIDMDGNAYLYKIQPTKNNYEWYHSSVVGVSHSSFQRGDAPWDESLISRYD